MKPMLTSDSTPTATPKSKPTGGRPVDVAEDRLAIPKLVEAAAVAGPSVQSASAVYDNVLAREDSYDNSVSGDEALSYEHKREPSSPQGNQIQPHSICPYKNSLNLSLNNGILKDNYGRQGYIASNFQFQFDGPPQAGALYTAGFSVCDDGRVALGSSRVWWQCLSGSFYNIYDRNYSAQCHQSYMVALPYRNNCTRPG